MSPNDADGMANSVDPDQTAPVGPVWSGSALFAQAYLSENVGTLRKSELGLQQVAQTCLSWSNYEHFFFTPGSDCSLLVAGNQNGAQGRTVLDWSFSIR